MKLLENGLPGLEQSLKDTMESTRLKTEEITISEAAIKKISELEERIRKLEEKGN